MLFRKSSNRVKDVERNNVDLKVSEVKVRLVDRHDDGLIAWASCVVNRALFLNNIAVRNSREGKLILSFPVRKKGNMKYFHFHPITREATRIIEDAILDKLIHEENVSNEKRIC